MEMKRWLSLLLTVCLLLGNVPLCTLATEEPAMPETTETAAEETAEETTAETTGETVGEIMGETTQPHAHDYRRQETAPTCTEQGFVTLVCSACGDSQPETVTTDITEAFSWTDGKMILATTGECTDYSTWQASDYVNISGAETVMIKTADTIYGSTTTGLAFYDANKAYISGVTHTDGTGDTYGTLTHTLEVPENAVYIRSTWYSPSHPNYEAAFGSFTCTVTGQYIPATGHSYALTEHRDATCSLEGADVYTCTTCGHSYEKALAKGEHRYDDGTCTVCGVTILGTDWIAPEFAQGDYTMVAVPDTQCLVQYWPEIYENQMKWIADNASALNIQAVLHMGDMVNNNNDAEWTVCETGTAYLDAAGIPWMPMRGNHDDSAWFNKYYDYQTYGTNRSWFGGSYEENKLDHTYWFVNAGGREYMILSLGWAPSWEVLTWAQGIVEAHPEKSVILVDHAYMNKDGTLLSTGDALCVSSYYPGYPDGEDVWDAFKGYENVVLAMAGHIHSPDIVTWTDTNGAGEAVTSLLLDRQDDDTANRYAMVALLTFHEGSDTVDINWYSTCYDALYRGKNQFSITVPGLCDHSDTRETVKPTCTEAGGTRLTCSLCGRSRLEDQVPAQGHNFEADVCTACGLARLDLTDRFTDWTEGGPVLFGTGYGYGEPGYTSGSNRNLKYSDYVSVAGYDTLELTVCARTGNSATGGYAFYTDKGTEYFISEGASSRNGNGAAAEGTVVHTVEVPEDARYIRVTYWVDSTTYAEVPFQCVGYTMEGKNLSLRYDDHYDITGKTVEIIDAGKPTSYQVGCGVEENTVPDTAVVTLEGDTLVATGIGTAQVKMDGVLYEITVTAAPISLLLLAGQSNMQGSEGDANQSIVCPDGMVYSTYGDRYTMTIDNATNFAPSALTGEYSTVNVNGNTDNLGSWPVYLLNEAGAGKIGPDSGFAYEWVQATGEKVWVVNAAHGGTSIKVWKPGTKEYEECQALFTACTETLRKEIAAGHFTLNHMAYFWCQGCADNSQTAQWYVNKYLTMHESFKEELSFDHDSDPATPDKTFEMGGIIPVRAGHEYYTSYRQGVYTDTTTAAYHESFKDLRFTGPRAAQYWMINNPELTDIWGVCNIGESWVWMPDGTNGVTDYFQAHYPGGTVDYTTQVQQKASWYTPTTPKAVHDSIHYNQIGYNEVGRESVRNALIILGEKAAPAAETKVEFLTWDGYTPAEEIKAWTSGTSGSLVVPKVSPLWKAKDITYTLSEGLRWEYYDLLSDSAQREGTLTANGPQGSVSVVKQEPGAYYADHLSQLPEALCRGVNLWSLLTHDQQFYSNGTHWAVHSSGSVYSVTIPVNPGDRIFATAFGKAGENGHASSNGIRCTFFGEYDVVKTLAPAETYSEFTANGGYLIVPEGAVAMNIPMWTGDDSNELYILNLAHDRETGNCGICSKDSHVHSFGEWETLTLPSAEGPGTEQRSCSCGETESRSVDGSWQKYDLAAHMQTMPETYCAGTDLWKALEHDAQYFTNGTYWGAHSSGTVYSVTIPVDPGDRIFATSFGKAGENGNASSNGIRVTFFDSNGVARSIAPSETYPEFTANGGFLIAPEGAIAVNIPMWNTSNDNEIYILNREHDRTSAVTLPTCTEAGYTAHTCSICGDSYRDGDVPALGHSFERTLRSVAHRGFSKIAPENTLEAYRLAKEKGFVYVECDVAFTADGVPVLLHDETIDRTSDGSGKVSELTYAQLQSYDFGSWKRAEYAGTKIPTFESFIALCGELGLYPYIELKKTGVYSQERIQQLVDIVERYGLTGKSCWISFSDSYLQYVKNADPTARLGCIGSGDATEVVIKTAQGLRTGENQVFLLLNYQKITDDGIRRSAANGFAVEVYTVNSESAVRALPEYVTGVVSDAIHAQNVVRATGAAVTAPTCTEKGYTTYTCPCGQSTVGSYTDALGHTWADGNAAIRDCTVCGQVEGGYRIDVSADEVWIDGVKYTAREDSKGKFVQLERNDASVLTVYSYNDPAAEDPHTQYPTGMQVWLLKFENGGYVSTYVPELDNLLQYAGTSIRVTGIKGIRMITGIDKALRSKLMDGSLGYRLLEYGTCVAWASDSEAAPVLGSAMWNYAYRKDAADPIFADTGDVIQYTNVLVGFTDDQLGSDLVMRPYLILETQEGERLTIYGGFIRRSIGYIALQNKDTFAEGTKAYTYIHDIISKVYG